MSTQWGYTQGNGPETWPKLYPEASGLHQSPIDIQQINIKTLNTNAKLNWRYVAENVEDIINPGYSWKVNVKGDGSELRGGPLQGDYVLEQFHCHWGATNSEGSEHTVNGKKYAGELHLVHWNKTRYQSFEEAAQHPDGLCVLGVFLTPGKRHEELDKVVAYLPKIEFKDEKTKIQTPVNPGLFLPGKSGYYTYQGSLTTPPCSECVIWIIFKKPVGVSNKQLEAFRNLKCYCKEEICPCDEFQGFVKNNFRPTLPLGQREIRECRQ